jgi:hypothetical protein
LENVSSPRFAVSEERTMAQEDGSPRVHEKTLKKNLSASGQEGKVNKTSSCVYLKHLLTGLE